MILNRVFKLLENKEKFRQKQVEKALFSDNIGSWKDATALSLALREELEREAPIGFDFDIAKSVQGTNFKAAIKLEDGVSVEAVLLRHEDGRNSVCVSSQAGCPMGCTFCRTASAGFARNLGVYEIVSQALFFSYFLKRLNTRITNVIFMGMGEPFLNYDNVMGAIRILNERHCFDIGARKISISTCGITEGIRKLAEEKLQLNLAVSLNAADDDLRPKLMPLNNKYPISKIIDAVRDYIKATNRRVMFEYVLLDGVNDSREQAERLAGLLEGLLCFVNLIPYNGKGKLKPPPAYKIRDFKEILEMHHISVTRRYSFGRDISAACGQLVYGDS